MNSRTRATLAGALFALGVGVASCADPATQPQVMVNVRGINAVTSGRGAGIGDVTIVAIFAPTTDGGSPRPHSRFVPWHNVDVESFTAQVPPGRYAVTALAYTVVDCNRIATQLTLGSTSTTVTIDVPTSNAMTVELTLNREPGVCR